MGETLFKLIAVTCVAIYLFVWGCSSLIEAVLE